jgi:hypothetical protein
MIFAPRKGQRVQTNGSSPTKDAGRRGTVVTAIGMLADVRWDDTDKTSSINGAYLDPLDPA